MVPVATDTKGKHVVDWDGMSRYGRALRMRAERSMNVVLEEAVGATRAVTEPRRVKQVGSNANDKRTAKKTKQALVAA
jgi:hypothetical protein